LLLQLLTVKGGNIGMSFSLLNLLNENNAGKLIPAKLLDYITH